MAKPRSKILDEIAELEVEGETGFTYPRDKSKSWKSIVLDHYDNCVKEGSKNRPYKRPKSIFFHIKIY